MTSKISKLGTVSEKQKSIKHKDKDDTTAVSKNKSISVRSVSAKKRMRAKSRSARIDSLISCSCSVFVIVVSIVAVLVLLLMDQFVDDLPVVRSPGARSLAAQRLSSINYSREFKFRPIFNASTHSAVRKDSEFPNFIFADMNQFCQIIFGRCSFFDSKFVENCSSTFCHALFMETSLENKTAGRFAYPPYLRIKGVKVERLGAGWGLRAPDFAPCAGSKQKTIAGYCEAGSCVVGGPLLRNLQILPKFDEMADKWESGVSLVNDLSRSCVRTADRIDFERLFHPNKFGCSVDKCDMTQVRIVALVCDSPYPFLGAAHCNRRIDKYTKLPFTFEISRNEYLKTQNYYYGNHCQKAVICKKDGFCKENVSSTFGFCCFDGQPTDWGLTIGGFCVQRRHLIYVDGVL